MDFSIYKKMTGRELSDAILPADYLMFYKFREMWLEINKTVSCHGIDPLNKDAEITFSIRWKQLESEEGGN